MPKYIICKNKQLKKRKDHDSDLSRRDLDAGCGFCYFMEGHKGDHWTEDWAHCTVGIDVKYGDKIEVIPARDRQVRLIKQRKKRKKKNK